MKESTIDKLLALLIIIGFVIAGIMVAVVSIAILRDLGMIIF